MRFAFFADTHLDYAITGRGGEGGRKVVTDPKTGLNVRVRDGYLALHETVTQILEAHAVEPIDAVIHGGDLFHYATPTPTSAAHASREFRRLTNEGVRVLVVAGNHDCSGLRSRVPAIASLHDPKCGVDVVVEPQRVINLGEARIHFISHLGLVPDMVAPIPRANKDEIDVLVSHGVAALPDHPLFKVIEAPNERMLSGALLTDPNWSAVLLGHYHSRGALPGLPHAWYAGSALRRGFSDGPGERGWLLCTLRTNGSVEIHPRNIRQRPQHDLPIVDAQGLTAREVNEHILANLAAVPLAGAIVRQRVRNCSGAIANSLDVRGFALATDATLSWQLRPEAPETSPNTSGEVLGFHEAKRVDLAAAWGEWATRWPSLPPEYADAVVASGTKRLADAAATEGD